MLESNFFTKFLQLSDFRTLAFIVALIALFKVINVLQKKKVTEVAYSYNKNLSIITAGKVPPNPAEMLASKAMTAFLKEMKEHFDYIVLDTPPVQAVADAQILSTKVDGTLVVVRAGVTKKDEVQNTVNTLKKVNADIIGTVLHAVDNTRNKYQYYYGNE